MPRTGGAQSGGGAQHYRWGVDAGATGEVRYASYIEYLTVLNAITPAKRGFVYRVTSPFFTQRGAKGAVDTISAMVDGGVAISGRALTRDFAMV